MSLDVVASYKVCCTLSAYLRFNEINLVIKFLEKNLWEYPTIEYFSRDSVKFSSWQEFLTDKSTIHNIPMLFIWDPNSYMFEDEDNEEHSETDDYCCPCDVLVLPQGHCCLLIKVQKSDQEAVRQYLLNNNSFVPSTLDIEPKQTKKIC